jgi:Putative lumazine-binding
MTAHPAFGTADRELVAQTALDYFEGWFDGDVTRMRRALHPELAKRAPIEDGRALDETTAEWMLDATAKHLAKGRDPGRIDVAVADVYGDIASAIVRSAVYHEYLHLVRTAEGWKLVNVLYQWTAKNGAADDNAISDVVLDYFEGWFDGDPQRMRRALHPDLVKRPGRVDHSVAGTLGTLTAREMIDRTAAGVGRTRDVPDRAIDVEVVDSHGDIACATVRSAVYHEYVHLVQTREGWKIVNTLWQWRPRHERRDAYA